MASNFGEVIELNSRSFVTDGEEWSLDKRYSLQVLNSDGLNEEGNDFGGKFNYLFVAFGRVMSDFTEVFLLAEETEIIRKYSIALREKEDEEPSQRKSYTAGLYKLSDKVMLYICEQLPHLYFAHLSFHKLKPFIALADHVVILTSEHMSSFKPRGSLDPFIRSLSTKACTMNIKAPNLELPNTISGFPATVLSWCQAANKSAAVYVMYSESTYVDSITVHPLHDLLKKFNFFNLPTINNCIAKLKTVSKRVAAQSSNLYM